MEEKITISLDEMKKIELDIMKFIDKICKENNIKYSLMDGSLLGAIRHQGFIPWDDDIDIMMSRPDYERFKDIFSKLNHEKYFFMDNELQKDCYYSIGKVVDKRTEIKEKNSKTVENYGICVDVFPIDGTYSNKYKRYFQMKRIFLCRYLLGYHLVENIKYPSIFHKFYKTIFKWIANMIGYKRLFKYSQKAMKECDYNSSEYVSIFGSGSSIKNMRFNQKGIFEKTKYVKFEDCEFCIIEEYDTYLKNEFGDYMQLPPVEKRVPHHEMEILRYRKENSND